MNLRDDSNSFMLSVPGDPMFMTTSPVALKADFEVSGNYSLQMFCNP